MSQNNQDPTTLLLDAVQYILNRCQRDPNLRYVMADTESWSKLVAAEAAATSQDEDALRRHRRLDLRPPHDQREADVVTLRRRVEMMEDQLDHLRGQL